MARQYTAQEMREASLWFHYPPNSTGKARRFDGIELSAMLRQAADLQEREERRKYEYAVRFADGTVSLLHEDVHPEGDSSSFVLVRREVGEWEEDDSLVV